MISCQFLFVRGIRRREKFNEFSICLC
uniref:Uncharacterized protein n=1 Tax=Rhizophora mucronata TaxID=61149 RepID=A0A2P2Q6R4_RHIMU